MVKVVGRAAVQLGRLEATLDRDDSAAVKSLARTKSNDPGINALGVLIHGFPLLTFCTAGGPHTMDRAVSRLLNRQSPRHLKTCTIG